MSYESHFGEILARAQAKADLVVAKTSTDIAAGAKAKTPPKVDTGALMSSWHAEPTGELEAEVSSGVEYAKYVEYGTHHPPRASASSDGGLDVTAEYTIGPHPMLVPSAEEAREPFEQAMSRIYT